MAVYMSEHEDDVCIILCFVFYTIRNFNRILLMNGLKYFDFARTNVHALENFYVK